MRKNKIVLLVDDTTSPALALVLAREVPQCEDLIVGSSTEIGDSVPSEIDLMIESEYKGYISPFDEKKTPRTIKVTGNHIDAALNFFKRMKSETPQRDLVIDYEHATWKKDKAPAAGWIKDMLVVARDNKKVLRGIVEWTEEAAEYIRKKQYRYFSPVFATNALDKRANKTEPCIFFDGALTNEPFYDDLQPIISSLSIGDTHMDELLSWLRSFMNLPLTATAEEILAELNKLSAQLQTAINNGTVTAKTVLAYLSENQPVLVTAKQTLGFQQQVIAKLGLAADATPEQALALIVTAKASEQQLALLNTQVQQLTNERFDERFGLVIATGRKDGRILPTQEKDQNWLEQQKAWAQKNFGSFETYYCKTGPVIGPVGPLPNNDTAAQANGLTDTDKEVAMLLGVPEAVLAKHNPVQK